MSQIDTQLVIQSLRNQISQLSYDKSLLEALTAQQSKKLQELEQEIAALKAKLEERSIKGEATTTSNKNKDSKET